MTTAPATPRTRARRGEGDRLRDELLEATEQLLVEAGEAAVTVRAVAARVGVSTPAVYLHFADKQALLDAVCLATWVGLSAAMRAAAEGIADPFEALRRRGLAYVQFGLTHREQYRVLLMRPHVDCTDPDCPVLAAGQRACDELTAAVERCVEQGVFRVADPSDTTLALWAAAHGVVSLVISGAIPAMERADIDALAAMAIEMAGLGAALRTRLPDDADDRGICKDSAALVAGLDLLAVGLPQG
ncbi:MAG TPA: WHG domain-containing protein [Mycobacteriales bacterium]|nr:WHG domain-containing protein [Mycobacteriales bacterium]